MEEESGDDGDDEESGDDGEEESGDDGEEESGDDGEEESGDDGEEESGDDGEEEGGDDDSAVNAGNWINAQRLASHFSRLSDITRKGKLSPNIEKTLEDDMIEALLKGYE